MNYFLASPLAESCSLNQVLSVRRSIDSSLESAFLEMQNMALRSPASVEIDSQ